MIIALSGKTGTGKTTLANHLAAMLPATVLSFATPLKDEVAELFGLPRSWLDTQEGKNRLVNGRSVRSILQLHGQQRRDEQPGYWVNALRRVIQQTPGNIVVDDVRYADELRMLLHADWMGYHQIRLAFRLEPYPGWEPGPHSQHSSETALDGFRGWNRNLNPAHGELESCAMYIAELLEDFHRG